MTGVELIAAERQRQIERWTSEHDDQHRYGWLAIAAASLAVDDTDASLRHPDYDEDKIVDPWNLASKHRGDRVRQLVISGALIAAEIDRLQRLACTCPTSQWIGSEPNDSTCSLSEEEHDTLQRAEGV